MPTLDPIAHAPQMTGPTRNMQAMTVGERQFREEPFQFDSKRLPVSLRKRTRPVTSTPRSPEIPFGRANILIRNSNVSPVEAGEGQVASQWRVNNRDLPITSGAIPGMSALEEDPGTHPTDSKGWSTGQLVGVGLALGLGAYLLTRAR